MIDGRGPRAVRISHALWTWTFLPLTALVVIMELVASFDSSPATEPWTYYTVDHIPPWITFAAIGVLITWLPIHFWLEYRRVHKVPQ